MTTMAASGFQREDSRSLVFFVVMFALSAGAHIVSIIAMPNSAPPMAANKPVDMEFFVPKPPPPPEPEPEKEEPKPLEPPKPVKLKIAVAKAETPKPPPDEPPPPNDAPPPDKPTTPVPIVVGISLSSTTTGGSFALGVGNTAYGKANGTAADPNSVKAYSAPKYAPPGGADTEPSQIGNYTPPYPEEAKKNEIEGSVRLRVTLDPDGKVTDATIISGPGYGLNEAARTAMLKHFKFKPATKGGENVGYTFVYTVVFLLD